MQSYELLYIIPATFTDDELGGVESNIKGLLEKYGASSIETKRLGKFRLTYPIKKVRYGHYILVNLMAEPISVIKLDEALRISKEVLRHLILRTDEVGGGKFNLVQFQEVDVEAAAAGRLRAKETEAVKEKVQTSADTDIKSGVAALETGSDEKAKDEVSLTNALTAEELDRKLDAVLQQDPKA